MSRSENKATSDVGLVIAIPARHDSTRLPGKPLADIGGKTMIEHVVANALALASKVQSHSQLKHIRQTCVLVATDHEKIAQKASSAGAMAVMTDARLQSGTDRIFAALESAKLPWPASPQDLVINIQGDEPFFSHDDLLSLMVRMLAESECSMGTMAFRRTSWDLYLRSSVVKVVTDAKGFALYFSRAPIAWPRDILGADGTGWQSKLDFAHASTAKTNIEFLHHIGVYAFRRRALETFSKSLAPSRLEKLESLEQLRAMEAGWKIAVVEAKDEPFGIDTPDDLERARISVQTRK